jgi:hypothetical protein
MSPEDIALFQQAIEVANDGQKQAAYEQFCIIHRHGNTEDVTLLYWLAFTTSDPQECQQAISTIAHIEPYHPKLQELRAYQNRKRLRPAKKRGTRRVLLISAIVLVALFSCYFVFFYKHIDGYMSLDGGDVRFLKWTESSGGQISGYWNASIAKDGSVEHLSGDLTGTRSGSDISLTWHYSIAYKTATGTLEGNTLTLQTPDANGDLSTLVYKGVTMKEYQHALDNFNATYGVSP